MTAPGGRGARRSQFVEDVEWLTGWCPPAEIARRLGYGTVDSMYRALHRAGRPDLAATIPRSTR